MDQHNKNKNKKPHRPNDKRNSNLRGIISLVCWALLLTSIISYAGGLMNESEADASVELVTATIRKWSAPAMWKQWSSTTAKPF